MDVVNVGIIGAGAFSSSRHMPTVDSSHIMNMRAIADIDKAKLTEYKNKYKADYTSEDYHNILEDKDVQMVVIGTRQDLHAQITIEALDAGKWVYCEKPLAQNENELRNVLEAEARNPGRLAVGFNRRFAPAYRYIMECMSAVKKPWFVNYRLMYPSLHVLECQSFYAKEPRIHYEGCHILDLICWFLNDVPEKVFMSGGLHNSACVFDFQDGSQATFLCGSAGSPSLWKEYMEIFGDFVSITASDLMDVRVRGVKDKFDKIFAPYRNEHAREIEKYGFDFYEAYKNALMEKDTEADKIHKKYGIVVEPVKRPTPYSFDPYDYQEEREGAKGILPDKGWTQALEHFADCLLNDKVPQNCDGRGGALSDLLALALTKSMNTGQAVNFTEVYNRFFEEESVLK